MYIINSFICHVYIDTGCHQIDKKKRKEKETPRNDNK